MGCVNYFGKDDGGRLGEERKVELEGRQILCFFIVPTLCGLL